MKIISCIKQVYNLDIVLENDWVVDETDNSVDIHYANRIINPYDEVALELMLRLKDSNSSLKTKAITVGEMKAKEILQKALAVGVDEALLIEFKQVDIKTPNETATLLYESVKKDKDVDLILCGKQSDISNYGQTGQILAEKLNWSCFTNVFKIEIKDDKYIISRLRTDGVEHITTKGPLVCTITQAADTFLRMATLRDTLNAKNKQIELIDTKSSLIILEDLPVQNGIRTISIEKPEKECIYLENYSELDELLSTLIEKRDLT